jgi:hypothetical protein
MTRTIRNKYKKSKCQRKRKQTRRRIRSKRYKGGSGNSVILNPSNNITKKMNCSPLITGTNVIEGTCIPEKEISTIKDIWNKHSSKKITEKSPKEVWTEITSNTSCNDDLCVLSKSELSSIKNKYKDYYSPKQPMSWKKNPTEWLSNIEILEKMKQYEKAYKCFEFLGPTPIDFDTIVNNTCVEKSLCNFNLKNYIDRGIKKIGIIFNTDPHDKSGEHWISLFINIKKQFIFFFDSAGDRIPKEIKHLVERITQQGKKLSPPIHFKFDEAYPHVHQKSTTECGMYSLYFIINMLEDKLSSEFLKTKVIPDEMMIDYRKKYFN